MATYPAFRLLWQRPLYRFALLGLLLTGATAWFVIAHGGWANTLGIDPDIDASTPRTQNGFTLLDVQRPSQVFDQYGQAHGGFQYAKVTYQVNFGQNVNAIDTADAFGLWIQLPLFANTLESGQINSSSSPLSKTVSVTARLSTGETLPLEWQWHSAEQAAQRLLFVSLPSGYSDACRFVDFTIADQNGHSAHWRITHIPQMRHAVAPPTAFTNSITQDGITMSAQAWHDQPSRAGGSVNYILRPMLPPNSHQWDGITTGQWSEWEPFAYDGHLQTYETSRKPILDRNGVFKADSERWYGGGLHDTAGSDPYPHENRFLRLTCELRQFETYDEQVTFHNISVNQDLADRVAFGYGIPCLVIPRPLTLTTPSGITVTLPAQGQANAIMRNIDDLNFLMSVTPSDHPVYLAHSPLVRQFDKPVTISVQFAAPYESAGRILNPTDTQIYSLPPPSNPAWHPTPKGLSGIPLHSALPLVLKDFTVIIRQRVDIRAIPMTFTLPIADHAPPYYPKGYQPPKSL